jgi:hypothetical protein
MRILAALILATPLALGGCQTSMNALAPASTAKIAGTSLALLPVQGPSVEMAQKFEAVLAQEAKKRGFEVAAAPGGTLKVKTFLDAYASEDGKTGFAWVMDASENGTTRAARVKGAAQANGPAAAPWTGLDDTAMRQIAAMSLDDLVRQLSGEASPAPATEDAP